MLGIWDNFEEMETKLTLNEFECLLEVKRDREFQEKKFMAALKGVNLDDPRQEDAPTFDDIARRAEAKLKGVSSEALEFAEIGIAVEEGD